MRRFRLRLPVRGIESEVALGRLSGLLSGCPPTGTRPQARAKLGKGEIRSLAPVRKIFSKVFLRPFRGSAPRLPRSEPVNPHRTTKGDGKPRLEPRDRCAVS